MRGMTDHLTIGERVAFYRRRRGRTQETVAGLVGRTAEWLRKVENNRAELDRLSVIRQLARVLDVSLGDLVGEPTLLEWTEESGQQTVPALRIVLMDYRHIAPTLLPAELVDDARPPTLDELEREITDVWAEYQRSRYGTLTRRLPYLLGDVMLATRHYTGDDGLWALRLSAFAHQITCLFLTKLGECDLAWIASSRGLAAAQASGDQVTIASLFRSCGHALCAIGEYGQAVQLVADATGYLQPGLRDPSPAYLSVYGSLHLVGGLAAARNEDRSSSTAHLAEASDAARRLGGDANHVWTAFGPTNVAIHRVAAAMELGDLQVALDLGPRVDTAALPIERRVRHAIEIARAYTRRNRPDDALAALLGAEGEAPEQVRYHYLSREVVRTIIKRPVPPRVAVDLAERMGVAGGSL